MLSKLESCIDLPKLCSDVYAFPALKSQRIEAMAKEKSIIECKDCHKIFTRIQSLKLHKRRFHTPVHCGECDKLLPSKSKLLKA